MKQSRYVGENRRAAVVHLQTYLITKQKAIEIVFRPTHNLDLTKRGRLHCCTFSTKSQKLSSKWNEKHGIEDIQQVLGKEGLPTTAFLFLKKVPIITRTVLCYSIKSIGIMLMSQYRST